MQNQKEIPPPTTYSEVHAQEFEFKLEILS